MKIKLLLLTFLMFQISKIQAVTLTTEWSSAVCIPEYGLCFDVSSNFVPALTTMMIFYPDEPRNNSSLPGVLSKRRLALQCFDHNKFAKLTMRFENASNYRVRKAGHIKQPASQGRK
jgi:hypothetical protein